MTKNKCKRRIVHLNISGDLLETSDKLQNNIISDEDLIFFQAHTGSKNSWYCFIFGMGLKKAKEDIEKFKCILEKETYGNQDKDKRD